MTVCAFVCGKYKAQEAMRLSICFKKKERVAYISVITKFNKDLKMRPMRQICNTLEMIQNAFEPTDEQEELIQKIMSTQKTSISILVAYNVLFNAKFDWQQKPLSTPKQILQPKLFSEFYRLTNMYLALYVQLEGESRKICLEGWNQARCIETKHETYENRLKEFLKYSHDLININDLR